MTIPEGTIEEIKARTDLCALVESYGVAVKRDGSGWWACCPFHSEKTPSFKIDPDKGFYHCFGCGKSGDAISLAMEMDGLQFVDAARKLADACGVKITETEDPGEKLRKRLYALLADVASFYRKCLETLPEAQIARDYLAGRDLDGKTAEDFCIGYAPVGYAKLSAWAQKNGWTAAELEAAGVIKAPGTPGDRPYHRFSGRLMFTIRDRQGRVVAFSGRQLVESRKSGKYVNSPETPVFKKSNVLFCFDRAAGKIAKTRQAIVCEGQIDAIRLHSAGFECAVASLGTAFTETHARMLARVADSAVLVFDDDAAGRKATVKTARILLSAGIAVGTVSLPDGHDPDSFLRTFGAEAFSKRLASACSIVRFQTDAWKRESGGVETIDSVARLSKEVIETVAACPNAVVRAKMADDAAKCLGVPSAAVAEELAKALAAQRRVASPERKRLESIEPGPETENAAAARAAGENRAAGREPGACAGIDAAGYVPPPRLELEFLEFLFSPESPSEAAAEYAAYFPRGLFSNQFTEDASRAWFAWAAGDGEALPAFQKSLDRGGCALFDKIVSGAQDYCTGRPPEKTFASFARFAWRDRLLRRRGRLEAGSADTDAERLRLTTLAKRIESAPWKDAAGIMENFTKGE